VERKKVRIPAVVKSWRTALAISLSLVASLITAEDFTTVKGKEYKDAEVTRVEADGIVLRTKSGISKVYFAELPRDVQQRFHPVQAPTAQPTASSAQQQARRQADARVVELHTPAVEPDYSPLFWTVVLIALVAVVISIIVAVGRAKQRRELRDRLSNDARNFTATLQQKRALPIVQTDIILKPDENAFYSTPSTLYETRAVRSYQAAHSGVRVAKGIYIGGTSGRSVSTQQWAILDTGRLTITNQRLVFIGKKEDRIIPLKKIVSVNNSLAEIFVSVDGRQKTTALAVPNPLIARIIIGICSQVSDPTNLSGDNINVTIKG